MRNGGGNGPREGLGGTMAIDIRAKRISLLCVRVPFRI